jgi:hypothetical protein
MISRRRIRRPRITLKSCGPSIQRDQRLPCCPINLGFSNRQITFEFREAVPAHSLAVRNRRVSASSMPFEARAPILQRFPLQGTTRRRLDRLALCIAPSNHGNVASGSWPCKNVAPLQRRRMDIPPNVAFGCRDFADLFGGESFQKIILDAFRFFEFSHRLGHQRTSAFVTVTSASPSILLQKSKVAGL